MSLAEPLVKHRSNPPPKHLFTNLLTRHSWMIILIFAAFTVACAS